MRIFIVLALICGPAFADTCPPAADVSQEMAALIAEAQAAPNAAEGRKISDRMWLVWLRAPDEPAQAVLDAGMKRRNSYDFAGALTEFNRLTEYCPAYAEGFNQRAYIHYLRENYAEALVDLDIALKLSPDHIAAQSGRALTLMKLGQMRQARAQMLIAVQNNPWLSEKALLAEGAPLGPLGKDI